MPSDIDELLEWMREGERRARLAVGYALSYDRHVHTDMADRFARGIAAVEELLKLRDIIERDNASVLEKIKTRQLLLRYDVVPIKPESADGDQTES